MILTKNILGYKGFFMVMTVIVRVVITVFVSCY